MYNQRLRQEELVRRGVKEPAMMKQVPLRVKPVITTLK